MKKYILYSFIFVSILTTTFSCTPMEKITYLNNEEESEWTINTTPPIHSLEVGDILIVKILSLDQETTNFFNVENNVNSANSGITAANIYLNGFTVNQEGMIEIPYIGKVHVLNQTIDQAKKLIEEKVDIYFKKSTVICKLGNFNVTVLGEVYRPNTFPVYKDNISIFEAIALSGGVTDYGNLTKVKLIRTLNNKKTIHQLDLTQQDIISSELYYLRNNDLLYVEPLNFQGYIFRKSQSQMILSAITTAAVIVNIYLRYTD